MRTGLADKQLQRGMGPSAARQWGPAGRPRRGGRAICGVPRCGWCAPCSAGRTRGRRRA